MFVAIVRGKKESYPVVCHREGDEILKPIVRAIRRRFALTQADGVTDDHFYDRG